MNGIVIIIICAMCLMFHQAWMNYNRDKENKKTINAKNEAIKKWEIMVNSLQKQLDATEKRYQDLQGAKAKVSQREVNNKKKPSRDLHSQIADLKRELRENRREIAKLRDEMPEPKGCRSNAYP